MKEVQDILRSFFNRNQERKSLLRHPIFITDLYHEYIIDENFRLEQVEFERNIRIENTSDYYLCVYF